MKLYCAIDLHSNNNVIVVIDHEDKILFRRRLPNDPGTVLSALEPYRDRLMGDPPDFYIIVYFAYLICILI